MSSSGRRCPPRNRGRGEVRALAARSCPSGDRVRAPAGVRVSRMTFGRSDKGGRFRPIPAAGMPEFGPVLSSRSQSGSPRARRRGRGDRPRGHRTIALIGLIVSTGQQASRPVGIGMLGTYSAWPHLPVVFSIRLKSLIVRAAARPRMADGPRPAVPPSPEDGGSARIPGLRTRSSTRRLPPVPIGLE